MRIGRIDFDTRVQKSPNFGLKIKQNEELKVLIKNWQVDKGYSEATIKKTFDNIKALADDSYEFEITRIRPYDSRMKYSINATNKSAAISERSSYTSISRLFMLRNIKKICNQLVKINTNAGIAEELYEYAGK